MGHSTRDRRLDEVRAVLHRLQHISDEPDAAGPTAAGEAGKQPSRAPTRRAGITAIAVAAVVVLTVLGSYAFLSFGQRPDQVPRLSASRASQGTAIPSGTMTSRPNAPVPPTPQTVQAMLQSAQQNMAGGRVQAARRELVRIGPEASADVAWALARSYDPNFLSTIPTADAAPDIAEATRWYRTWHTLAVQEGLVADSVPLERIIRSMR